MFKNIRYVSFSAMNRALNNKKKRAGHKPHKTNSPFCTQIKGCLMLAITTLM